MDISAESILQELWSVSDPEKRLVFPQFFKAGPGGYGEGDKFIGVDVPNQRRIAKVFRDLPLVEIAALLAHEYHEARLTALFILADRYQRTKDPDQKSELNAFYLSHLDGVNNWDLVDCAAYKILGAEIVRTGQVQMLEGLADSGNIWRERVAIIATLALIKAKDFEPTLTLCRKFLNHPHDLIHKATGWMLREVGKINRNTLELFLARHSKRMPRTMLRYAIEKLPKHERDLWLERSRV